MSSKARRHTHKYHQVRVGSDNVWACALPYCSHYMPAHMSNMVPGKASICWSCNEEFILDPVNMKMEKPICSECSLIKSIADGNPELKHEDDTNKSHVEPITKDKLLDLFKE